MVDPVDQIVLNHIYGYLAAIQNKESLVLFVEPHAIIQFQELTCNLRDKIFITELRERYGYQEPKFSLKRLQLFKTTESFYLAHLKMKLKDGDNLQDVFRAITIQATNGIPTIHSDIFYGYDTNDQFPLANFD